MPQQRKQALHLLIGDVLILYFSLAIVLLIRYGQITFLQNWETHLIPFTTVFLLWLLIFYIVNLYEPVGLVGHIQIAVRVTRAMLVGGVLAITLFYLIPQFIITPKTNLIIHIISSTIMLTMWRYAFSYLNVHSRKLNIIIIGNSPAADEAREYITNHPEIGHAIVESPEVLTAQFLIDENIAIVVAEKASASAQLSRVLFFAIPTGVRFIDFPTFHENLLGKIPLSEISEVWFLENIIEQEKRLFEIGKRGFDLFSSIIIGAFLLILLPFIVIAIKLTTRGPVFYTQTRVGLRGKHFELFKFRTMINDAEKDGAQFAKINDARITRVGALLRKTRIDELPQVINVLRGELSFIGPRPERPEIIQELEKEIPFYDVRLIVRPGLSGWAQINPPYYYGTNAESMLKVQYDLFYIKNRSAALDLSIALKTLSVMLSRSGR